MMTLLSGTIQPPLLTLLSSTSDPAVSPLFTITEDPECPKDAFISVLRDDEQDPSASISSPKQTAGRRYVSSADAERGDVYDQVIHIQSPDLRKTFLQAGSLNKGKRRTEPLGIELPWVGLQMKRLGRRAMSFEFGLIDARGREGVIRISSYKKEPSSHTARMPPLIHLPLQLPTTDQHTLTPWLDIKLNLGSLLPLFKTLTPSLSNSDDSKRRKAEHTIPEGRFGSVSYVRVYANCRLRRIWFSADGERTLKQAGVEEEWGLYASGASHGD